MKISVDWPHEEMAAFSRLWINHWQHVIELQFGMTQRILPQMAAVGSQAFETASEMTRHLGDNMRQLSETASRQATVALREVGEEAARSSGQQERRQHAR